MYIHPVWHVHPPSMASVLVYPSLDRQEGVEGTFDQQRLWSDCVDAQVDMSLHWSCNSYCRFCRVLAYMYFITQSLLCLTRLSVWYKYNYQLDIFIAEGNLINCQNCFRFSYFWSFWSLSPFQDVWKIIGGSLMRPNWSKLASLTMKS